MTENETQPKLPQKRNLLKRFCANLRKRLSNPTKTNITTTDPRAARIIDNLIVLIRLEFGYSYNCVQQGLDYIEKAREEYPHLSITVSTLEEIYRRREA